VYCMACGQELPDEAAFCWKCGVAVGHKSEESIAPSSCTVRSNVPSRVAGDALTCPYCRTAIESGTRTVVCPACELVHHADCWEENRGCSTYGCRMAGAVTPRAAARPAAEEQSTKLRPATSRRKVWSMAIPILSLVVIGVFLAVDRDQRTSDEGPYVWAEWAQIETSDCEYQAAVCEPWVDPSYNTDIMGYAAWRVQVNVTNEGPGTATIVPAQFSLGLTEAGEWSGVFPQEDSGELPLGPGEAGEWVLIFVAPSAAAPTSVVYYPDDWPEGVAFPQWQAARP
jgi:hypothetical protein